MAVASSPEVLGALAHDLRWTIVGLLAPGDLRTSELVSRTGEAPSLVSYHLARLRDAGLVSARRSTADGRDSYQVLDLDALGQALADMATRIHPSLGQVMSDMATRIHPSLGQVMSDMAARIHPSLVQAMADTATRIHPSFVQAPSARRGPSADLADPLGSESGPRVSARVVFICSGNSARSPMAAGWLNHLGAGRVTALSAGVTPRPLHPLAVAAMAEHGVDISAHQATHLDAFADQRFTRVITLCDRARENCGELPAAPVAAHWSIPDPSRAHPPDLDAFRATASELRTRVRYLLPMLAEAGART
jgi:ArsR family transcriptional regulator, arsenate/arsenite/antimonite-responsive transcriptional repressor / arsenate reductase (thioredoxin)